MLHSGSSTPQEKVMRFPWHEFQWLHSTFFFLLEISQIYVSTKTKHTLGLNNSKSANRTAAHHLYRCLVYCLKHVVENHSRMGDMFFKLTTLSMIFILQWSFLCLLGCDTETLKTIFSVSLFWFSHKVPGDGGRVTVLAVSVASSTHQLSTTAFGFKGELESASAILAECRDARELLVSFRVWETNLNHTLSHLHLHSCGQICQLF